MRMWERREEAIAYFFASLKRAGYLGGSAGGQMMLKELFCLSLSLSRPRRGAERDLAGFKLNFRSVAPGDFPVASFRQRRHSSKIKMSVNDDAISRLFLAGTP